MSKASFYGIAVKTRTVHAPRRRQRSQAEEGAGDRRHAGRTQPRPSCHPAPQFRRNRRFWLRRLGLDK
jgi:hypothetical protein